MDGSVKPPTYNDPMTLQAHYWPFVLRKWSTERSLCSQQPRERNNLRVHQRTKKMCAQYTMEYHSAIKKMSPVTYYRVDKLEGHYVE
jgi:hypothetical protein